MRYESVQTPMRRADAPHRRYVIEAPSVRAPASGGTRRARRSRAFWPQGRLLQSPHHPADRERCEADDQYGLERPLFDQLARRTRGAEAFSVGVFAERARVIGTDARTFGDARARITQCIAEAARRFHEALASAVRHL